MSRPLDDNGEPPLSLAHTSQPATPDVPSLVYDANSTCTISPAPYPPQRPNYSHAPLVPEFRRPTAPSTASSRRKRTRDDDATSTSSPSKRSRTSDSTFAASCKAQLQTQYTGCCVCGVTHNLHGAHVFDKSATSEFEETRRRGLVSLETVGDFENAIYLCPADHAAFDAGYPQLIIVPTYMEYFTYHERRWQAQIKTTTPPYARVPVTPSLYAAYCAERKGIPLTHGLYTAYPVVDYKDKDIVGLLREFQWHGDPGAIIWKSKKLIGAELTFEPRPPHLQELKNVRKILSELRDLREEGDEEWTRQSNLHALKISTWKGSSPGPSSHGGNGAGADSSGNAQPPPPAPPSGHPGTADQSPTYSLVPTTFSSLADASLYSSLHGLKRKRADSDSGEEESCTDTLRVAVTVTSPRKRVKPLDKTHLPAVSQQEDRHSCRWGGPMRSTNETVRYWNAIFGSRERSASKPP